MYIVYVRVGKYFFKAHQYVTKIAQQFTIQKVID